MDLFDEIQIGDIIPADFERLIICHTCLKYDKCKKSNSNFICKDYSPEEDIICCGSCTDFKECGHKAWNDACRHYSVDDSKYKRGGR